MNLQNLYELGKPVIVGNTRNEQLNKQICCAKTRMCFYDI